MTKNKDVRKTCIGKAKFCYISEPDTQFDPKGVYHVSVEFDKTEVEQEIKAIRDVIAEKVAEVYKAKPGAKDIKRTPLPYKEEDGKIVIKFKSKFKPKGFDKKNRELPKETIVYKGSTLRVRYKLHTYDQSIGIGCSLYLLSFQVKDLIEGVSEQVSHFKSLEENGSKSALPGPEKVVAL